MKKNDLAVLEKSLDAELGKHGLTRTGLRYAVKADSGYRILDGKNDRMRVLQEMLPAFTSVLPNYTEGEIADMVFTIIHRD